MPDTPKSPKRYSDLSLLQLKTFADRGDARAQQELDRRMGGPKRSAAAAKPQPPLRSVSVPGQVAPQQNTASAAAPRSGGAAGGTVSQAHVPAAHSARTPPPFAEAAAGGVPNEAMLYSQLPPGQTLSPELLSRLNDIASRAPEPETQPPLVLGGGMLFIGVILLLFGFRMTHGPTGTWYYVACGLALSVSGWLYIKGKSVAWLVYGASLLMAIGWAFKNGTWLEAVANLLPFFVLSIFAFSPGTRERLS